MALSRDLGQSNHWFVTIKQTPAGLQILNSQFENRSQSSSVILSRSKTEPLISTWAYLS